MTPSKRLSSISHFAFCTLRSSRAAVAVSLTALAVSTGCRKSDMSSQPKFYHPYSATAQFADGTTARPIPAGTVARGHLALETDFYTGMAPGPDGKPYPISYIPTEIGRDEIKRGQQKFNIYCAVCHGKIGDGQGMVVSRGMIRPPTLVWVDRPMTAREINVQRAPIGHYFDVITNGYAAMYSYNDKLSVEDRWCVAAYIKALQVSQDADLKHVAFVLPKPTSAAPVPVQTDPTKPFGDEKSPPPMLAPTGAEPAMPLPVTKPPALQQPVSQPVGK